jgi:hypothetical protein
MLKKLLKTIRHELGVDDIIRRLDAMEEAVEELKVNLEGLAIRHEARHRDQKRNNNRIFNLEGKVAEYAQDARRIWQTYQQLKRGLPKEVIAGDFVHRGRGPRDDTNHSWVVLVGIENDEARVLTLRGTKGQPMQTFVNMINQLTQTEAIRHDALIDCGPMEQEVLRSEGPFSTQTLRRYNGKEGQF